MRGVTRYLTNDCGTSAAEFALVLLPFSALVFAIVWMGLLLYSDNQLQQSTEAAARCWSISLVANTAGTCLTTDKGGNPLPTDPTAAQTYVTNHYKGLGTVTFPTGGGPGTGCAHEVDTQVTIPVNVVVYSRNVQISAKACFP